MPTRSSNMRPTDAEIAEDLEGISERLRWPHWRIAAMIPIAPSALSKIIASRQLPDRLPSRRAVEEFVAANRTAQTPGEIRITR